MNRILGTAILGSVLLGCGGSKNDSDTAADGECTVAEDCTMEISVWDPTCDGDILQTPSGSGENDCVEGECVMDFELIETDCTEAGQVCGTDSDGSDACVDPAG